MLRLLRLVLPLGLLAMAPAAQARQTIINMPSVKQTMAGRVFALHESQLRDWGDNSYWLTTNFFT